MILFHAPKRTTSWRCASPRHCVMVTQLLGSQYRNCVKHCSSITNPNNDNRVVCCHGNYLNLYSGSSNVLFYRVKLLLDLIVAVPMVGALFHDMLSCQTDPDSTSHSLNSNNYSISSNRNRLQFIDCLKGSLESQGQRVRVRPEQRGGGRVHSGRVRRLLRRFHVVVPRRTGIKMDRKLPKMGENRLLSFLGTALYRVFLV